MGSIIEIFKIKDSELLLLILSSTIFIWLFKEFRMSYIEDKKTSKIDIEFALAKYSALYHSIVTFQSNEIDIKQLLSSFDQAIPYLPGKITKASMMFSKNYLIANPSDLDNLQNMLETEIMSLKDKQYSFTSLNSDDSVYKQSSWFFTKYHFDALLNPLVYSLFTLYGMLIVFLLGIKITELDGYEQLLLVLLVINSSFALMSFIYMFDLLIKKLINKKAILYHFVLVLLPFIITITFFQSLAIINTLTILCFFIISFKKGLLRVKKYI